MFGLEGSMYHLIPYFIKTVFSLLEIFHNQYIDAECHFRILMSVRISKSLTVVLMYYVSLT
jgi:hypothetical protein